MEADLPLHGDDGEKVTTPGTAKGNQDAAKGDQQ
jgi:hypothetical protein